MFLVKKEELFNQRSYFQKIPESFKILKIKKVFLQIITQGKIGILNKNHLGVYFTFITSMSKTNFGWFSFFGGFLTGFQGWESAH